MYSSSFRFNDMREHCWIPVVMFLTHQIAGSFIPPIDAVNRGIHHFGSEANVARAIHLASMYPNDTSIAALGGSITAGHSVGARNWFNIFVDWFNEYVYGSRNKVKALNFSKHGMGPEFAEACVLDRVPENCRVVFIEFAVNDWNHTGPMYSSGRLALERIFRSFLSRSVPPLVVLLNFHPLGHVGDRFYDSSEDKFLVLAQYYGIPVLSGRAAFFGLYDVNSTLRSVLFQDSVHPSKAGHQWHAELAKHMFSSARKFDSFKNTGVISMPRPMFSNNSVINQGKCLFGSLFRSVNHHTAGFEWRDETMKNSRFGFVAMNPDDYIRLLVPVHINITQASMTVMLSFLHSYHDMGVASLSCMQCLCDNRTINTAHSSKVSVPVFHSIDITLSHHKCYLQVRVANITKSSGHKIKLLGMVTSYTGLDRAASNWYNFIARVGNVRR